MEEIKILRAKQEDKAYIEEKLEKYVLDAANMDWRQFFIAKYNQKIVAFGRIIDHGDYFEIGSLGVDYYHRKKGIGIKMFKFLINEARSRDPQKPIYGVTHVPEFVKKAGFKEVDAGPRDLEYKRDYMCKLDRSKIKILKL